VAVAAGGIMLVTGTRAFFHYKEAKALERKKSKCSILSNVAPGVLHEP
jgi:hypothetical protein